MIGIGFFNNLFNQSFFVQISKSFPFLKKLTIINEKPQNNKQCETLDGNHVRLSVIEYPYLSHLHLSEAQDDYIEEFLSDTKTYLRNNILVNINYESLERVTEFQLPAPM